MLGQDLAGLYDVPVKRLSEAVKRNVRRFPPDFMYQLTSTEWSNLKPQFATSSWGGLRRAIPYAFTEQGIAMLSSVLRSERAVQVNIAIMRAFVRLRHALIHDRDLIRRVEKVEGKIGLIETDIRFLLMDVRELKSPAQLPGKPPAVVKGFDFDKE